MSGTICNDAHTFLRQGQRSSGFLFVSPMMIVVSAVRLVASVVLAILTAIVYIANSCCCRKKEAELFSQIHRSTWENGWWSVKHLFFAIGNISTLGILASCTSSPDDTGVVGLFADD